MPRAPEGGQPSLPVGTLPVDGIPRDGEEYLAMVRAEAQNAPSILVHAMEEAPLATPAPQRLVYVLGAEGEGMDAGLAGEIDTGADSGAISFPRIFRDSPHLVIALTRLSPKRWVLFTHAFLGSNISRCLSRRSLSTPSPSIHLRSGVTFPATVERARESSFTGAQLNRVPEIARSLPSSCMSSCLKTSRSH